jgi:hypothetical protein
LPLRKNRVRGFGHAPWFASSCGGHGRFLRRVHAINARRAKPASKSLKGPHGTGHTLAISDVALSAYFNLQDRLAKSSSSTTVTSRNSRRQASSGRSPDINGEQDRVVQLFRFPVESLLLKLLRPLACRFVELLIFLGKLVRGGVRGLGLVGCWEDREGGVLRVSSLYAHMRLQCENCVRDV